MYRGLMSSQSSGNTNYHEDILASLDTNNHEYGRATDDLPGSEFELAGHPTDQGGCKQPITLDLIQFLLVTHCHRLAGKDEDHESPLLYYWSKPAYVYGLTKDLIQTFKALVFWHQVLILELIRDLGLIWLVLQLSF